MKQVKPIGWIHESMRHSLAARGIKTNYFYHGTILNRIPLIKRSGGLKPDVKKKQYGQSENYVYITTDIGEASEWAEEIKEHDLQWRTHKKFKLPSYRWCLMHGKPYPKVDKNAIEEFERSKENDDLGEVILRVRKSDLLKIGAIEDDCLSGHPNSYKFSKKIPIDIIEIETTDGWKRLKK